MLSYCDLLFLVFSDLSSVGMNSVCACVLFSFKVTSTKKHIFHTGKWLMSEGLTVKIRDLQHFLSCELLLHNKHGTALLDPCDLGRIHPGKLAKRIFYHEENDLCPIFTLQCLLKCLLIFINMFRTKRKCASEMRVIKYI